MIMKHVHRLPKLQSLVMVLFLVPVLQAFQAHSNPAADTKGHFLDERTYNNPALGMTITLPGAWEFYDQKEREELGVPEKDNAADPGCRGPLCGNGDIDVGLISKFGPREAPKGAMFLTAYKLDPKYLDHNRYPLKKFAEAMTKNSLVGTDWELSGDLTALEIDRTPAYRLLVHKSLVGGHETQGLSYVAESNGYVFLLIATVSDLNPEYPKELQAAMEHMKLTPRARPHS